MTRLAILSDIHGNLPALEQVLADLARFPVDRVIVAGDVINWGPFSAAVVARVVSEGWAVIRGNNEFYLLDYGTPRAPAGWNDPLDWALLPWLHRQLADPWLPLIATWPDSLSLRFPDAPSIRVVHGTPRSPWEPIYPQAPAAEVAALLAGVEETTVIAAHTHLAMDRQVGRWHLLNPGQVGVSVDGTFTASYMLLDGTADGWTATLRRLPVDYRPALDEFARQRFVEECGILGRLVEEEFRTARLQVHPFMHWRRAYHPTTPLNQALLDRFTTVDRWAFTPAAYHVNRERA